ncbi:hypothetical protein F4808DRAFT_140160 [Astrocystis sublimbata]|nr:hypothetical protein F4808DRAFT_140160 [Astrocystis sublimbata]
MQGHRPERHLDRDDFAVHPPFVDPSSLWDRLQQPSILVPLAILLLTLFYQSLHSEGLPVHVRHPGQLVWDLVVTVTPARFLYALHHWLHPPLVPVPDTAKAAQLTSYDAKSDLLRRILSMDSSTGIMNAVAHAGKSLTSLPTIKSRHVTDQPPGLGNYDNSCFQNSILQSLSSLKPLPAYLESAFNDIEAIQDDRNASSVATLRDLLSKLTGSQDNGVTLWTPKKLKSLDTWQQQDAQEYFSKILDEIDKEITKVASAHSRSPGLETFGSGDDTVESQHSDDSGYQSLSTHGKPASETKALKNPLEGLIAQRVACVECGHSEGLSMIPFNCITLSLGVGQGAHDLFERLDSYTALEAIQGVECAKCTLLKAQRLWNLVLARSKEEGQAADASRESLARLQPIEEALEEDDFEEETLRDKCKILKQHRLTSTKTKQMVIGRPPASLAVHINRSVFDENTGQMFKNLAAVRFPSTLDLAPWCLGSAGSYDTAQDVIEQWSSDPRSSMVSGDHHPSKISGPIYELRAVITHQGRHENGHYVCYRKHPRQHNAAPAASSNESDETQSDDQSQPTQETQSESEGQDVIDEDSKWWRLSDETVWEVDEETVLAQSGVFMLFYDCVDASTVLVSENRDQQSTSPAENMPNGKSESHDAIANLDGQDESQIAPSETEAPQGTESVEPPVGPLPRPNRAIPFNTHEQALDHATSCLYPLLKENEEIDATIPQNWPNS